MNVLYFQSQKSILDLLQQLKSEISTLKVKNQEQDREILQLRQKVAVFESSSSPFQDDISAARKGDSAKLSSSSAIPSAITGPSSCQEISNLNQDFRVNGFYIVKNAAAQRMMVVYCSFDGPGKQKHLNLKPVQISQKKEKFVAPARRLRLFKKRKKKEESELSVASLGLGGGCSGGIAAELFI